MMIETVTNSGKGCRYLIRPSIQERLFNRKIDKNDELCRLRSDARLHLRPRYYHSVYLGAQDIQKLFFVAKLLIGRKA